MCIEPEPGACDASQAFALSGGDNWTGPAISSYFAGRPMAETMRKLGYSAFALGNHELDFGQQTFAQNAAIQGTFLSANLRMTDAALPVRPFVIFERNAVRIGVVGVTTVETPKFLPPSAVQGLTFDDEEQALARVIPEVWNAGADVVILLAHVCPDVVKPIVARHPEWNLAFATAGHCHALKLLSAGKVPIVEPAAELNWYARIAMTVDLSRPRHDRLVRVRPSLVQLGRMPVATLWTQPVRDLQEHIQGWRAKTNEALGEVVGFCTAGMRRESPVMVRWILGAWRRQTNADVALMSRYEMRQNLPRGPVRARDLWDILPLDNRLVVMKLTGRDLVANAECCSPLIDGMRRVKDKWVLRSGKKVEPEASYVVVAPDDAFHGATGFSMHEHASEVQFGSDWREPVLQWTREHRSSPGVPLELIVAR